MSVPSAILAVGSSTFPKEHWNHRRKLNKRNQGLNAPETYRDIDLLIVPERVVKLQELKAAVQQMLDSSGYKWQSHEITSGGISYCKSHSIGEDGRVTEGISPWANIDYGLHSVSTNLRNGRKLDLIVGRDDLIEVTAQQKIERERENNNAFSSLYRQF